MFVGGAAFQATHILGREWGISLALGFISIPLAVLIQCTPPPLEHAFIGMRIMRSDEVLPTTGPETAEWNEAITRVSLFSGLRGRCVNGSPLKSRKSRIPQRRSSRSVSRSVSLARHSQPTELGFHLQPSFLRTSSLRLAQGGHYHERAFQTPLRTTPKSPAAPWEGKIQLHPDTSHQETRILYI